MHPPRPFRYTISVCGVVVLVGAVFVAVWLFPLSFRQHVAWRTVWPLWTAALGAVLETALLIGTPVGLSLGTRATQPGSEEPAGGSGDAVRRWRLNLRFLTIWLMLTTAVAAYANVRFGAPGNVVRGVIGGAREDCLRRGARASVPVPLIGARWSCSPTEPPSLVGTFSRRAASAKYAARGIDLSHDLATISLSNLEVSMPAASGVPSMHLSVQTARLRGAWPWARHARLPGVARAVYVASVASMLGMLTIVLAVSRRPMSRLAGVASAVAGGITGWLLLRMVDAHDRWGLSAYVVVPLGAALAMTIAWWMLDQYARFQSKLRRPRESWTHPSDPAPLI